jgi:hypothetical protein
MSDRSNDNPVSSDSAPDRPLQFGLRSLFAAVGVVVAVLVAIQTANRIANHVDESMNRPACVNNIKNLGMALRWYESQVGNLPPVHTLDQSGQPLTSWRTLILPRIQHHDVFSTYDQSQPWNAAINKRASDIKFELLRCPSDIALDLFSNLTSYVAIISPGGAWTPGRGLTLNEIKDKLSDTILLVEMRNSDIAWAEPRDLDLSNLPPGLTPQNLLTSIANHPGIIDVLFADGSVQSIPTSIPWSDFLAMLTIAGGETIDRSAW